MRFHLSTVFITVSVFSSWAYAETTRELDAHEHGHGRFSMAVEQETIAMELEVPAFDILGFEHKAHSAEELQAVEQAEKSFADPVALFGLSDKAGCRVTDADIEIGAGKDHDNEHHDDAHHDEDHHDEEHAAHSGEDDHNDDDHHDDHGDEQETHSEVHARYTLTCRAASEIKSVNASVYFETFPNAEELDAAIFTDAAQTSGELEADSPELTF